MKKYARSLVAVLIAIVMMFSFAACGGGSQKPEDKPDDTEPEKHVVVDYNGNEVELPAQIDYVSPGVNSMSQITAMLGGASKIVAAGPMIMKNEFFRKVFPDFKAEYGNENVEDIMSSGAQVVYGPEKDESKIAQYKDAGIDFVYLGSFQSIDEIKWTIKTICDILGGEAPAKAQKFIDYFDETITELQDKVKDIPEEERVRVCPLSYREGTYSVGNSSNLQNSYLKAVGGKLIGIDAKENSVNVEELVEFDPEVIFCFANNYNDIMNAENLQNVSAIVNKRVYAIPSGTFGWGVNNAEAAGMGPLFYAKYLYPDLYEDLDLSAKTKEFYKTFYDYDLTDEEVAQILSGDTFG